MISDPGPDLVVRGGRLLDPARGLDERGDLAAHAGRVIAVGPRSAGVSESAVAIPAEGLLVVPGLIDMHVHICEDVTDVAAPFALAGVASGVTVLCDCGSAGAATIDRFARATSSLRERVFCFLNIAHRGLAALPEIRDETDVDEMAVRLAVERHPDLIRGIKVRAVGPAVTTMGLRLIERALSVSRECRLPLMVHIGEEAPAGGVAFTRELLPLLDRDDVVTHAFSGLPGGLLDERGEVLPEAVAAAHRGVLFDVGRGRINLGIAAAARLLEAGIVPDVISSDVSSRFPGFPGPSLTDTMSLFLALGMSLPDVLAGVTSRPAGILGIQSSTGLVTGADADITLLVERRGSWTFRDGIGGTLTGEVALVPVLTIVRGTPHLAGPLPGSAFFP